MKLTKSVTIHTVRRRCRSLNLIFEEYKEFRLLTKVILFSRIEDAMSR